MVKGASAALSQQLTYLPPESPFPPQVARYVVVACLTVCVWDWLLSLSDELEMIRHGKQCRPYLLHVVYVVVRICPILYLVATINLARGTPDTTRVFMLFIAALNTIMMPATSILFFIRLRAVYLHDKCIVTFFGSCWLVTVGFFVFDSAHGIPRCSNIDQLAQCFALQPPDAWGYIATAAYDTLMYISISWQLTLFAKDEMWEDRLWSFFTGDGLGWLSKVLLQSGQIYYFMTIGFSVSTTIFIYGSCVPPEWRGLCIPPNITVASTLACRLFRELKLGLIVGPMTEEAISNLVFREMVTIPLQHSQHAFELRTLDDVGVETGISRERNVCGDGCHSGEDIELGD